MKLPLRDVLVRAWQRGYKPEEIAGCLVKDLGDGLFEVNTGHPQYPATKKENPEIPRLHDYLADAQAIFPDAKLNARKTIRAAGPGTELKKLLRGIGITASPGCSCNARARTMDANGIDWCEANIDTIVGWLRQEAGKRRLPFVDAAGRLLVRRAIKNARKVAAS